MAPIFPEKVAPCIDFSEAKLKTNSQLMSLVELSDINSSAYLASKESIRSRSQQVPIMPL